MNIQDAQHDMRMAYAGGSTGIFASSLAWLASGIVARIDSPKQAVLALFAAGIFIYPASVLLAKALGRSGTYAKANPLAPLAMESTLLLILGLPVAYVVSLHQAAYFYPAMMLIIGGRYLVFHTLYGSRVYWVLGAALAIAAYLVVATKASVATGAFVGAGLEAAFSVLAYVFAGGDRPVSSIERSA